jgi:hypothetical protein
MSIRQISRRHHAGSHVAHQALVKPAGSPRHKQEALPPRRRCTPAQTPGAPAAVICPAASSRSAGRVAGVERDVGAEFVIVVLVDQVGFACRLIFEVAAREISTRERRRASSFVRMASLSRTAQSSNRTPTGTTALFAGCTRAQVPRFC